MTTSWKRQRALRDRPAGRLAMRQCWDRLLFLHWRVPPELIQPRLPNGLTVDTFGGDAWLGVVPFFMRGIRLRGWPAIPTTSSFLELNLRTYVVDERGVPGVWFFSLDANSWLAVQGAKLLYGLPYRYATMSAAVDLERDEVDYRSHRRGTPIKTASRFVYRPGIPLRTAEPGTLEFFLIERYLLYSCDRRGKLYTGRVWHEPYRFADAEVTLCDDRLLMLNGFPEQGCPPDHAVVAPGVEVEVFALEQTQAEADESRALNLQPVPVSSSP